MLSLKFIEFYNNLSDKHITFDLSSKCCFKCVYCPFQTAKTKPRSKDYIDFRLVKKVVNEISKYNIFYKVIVLAVSGEALLHPKIKEIFTFLFEKNYKNRFFDLLSINTNAVYLNKKIVELINSYLLKGYGRIHYTLSINAASRNSFKKIKGKDLFNLTYNNTRYLLEQKKNLKLGFKQVILLQYLIHDYSLAEASKFLNYWRSFFNKNRMEFAVDYEMPVMGGHNVIIFKRLYMDDQTKYDKMHKQAIKNLGLDNKEMDLQKYVPAFHKVERQPCGSLWLSPIIRVDGTLSPCLQDTMDEEKIGDLKEKSFLDLWFSEKANRLRMLHINKQFDKIKICENCNYYSGPGVNSEEIKEFLHILNSQSKN